jgi:hypothetical protein
MKMPIKPIRKNGVWADVVVLPNGNFGLVYFTYTKRDGFRYIEEFAGDLVVIDEAENEMLRGYMPKGMHFMRSLVSVGKFLTVAQGHMGGQLQISLSGRTPIEAGPTHGENPVVLQGTSTGFRIFVMRAPNGYEILDINSEGQIHNEIQVPCAWTSQGFLGVHEDKPYFTDQNRSVVRNGVELLVPHFAHLGLAAQYQNDRGIAFHLGPGVWKVIDGDAFNPHLAYSNDRYCVAARKPNEVVEFAILTAPFNSISQEPEPEEPGDKPVEIPNHLELVKRVKRDLYGSEDVVLNDERKAFQITKNVAWQLKHLGIGLVWREGRSPNIDGYSVDKIIHTDGRIWDVLEKSETLAKPFWHGPLTDLRPDIYRPAVDPGNSIPVDPADPVDPNNPPDNGDTGDSVKAVLAMMMKLIEQNERIIVQNEEIKKSFNEGLTGLKNEITKGIKVRF